MATRFAERTGVASEKTRNEIERLLTRYGATAFSYGRDDVQRIAVIAFRMQERHIKFSLPLPDRRGKEITHTAAKGLLRDQDAQEAAFEQAVRQRWRALLLIIKAKLEAVEAGIVTVEDEFLSTTLLANGQTIGEWAGAQVDEIYRRGEMPSLLPGATRPMLSAPSP